MIVVIRILITFIHWMNEMLFSESTYTLTILALYFFNPQDCEKNLLFDLVVKLKPVLYLPRDYICKKVSDLPSLIGF